MRTVKQPRALATRDRILGEAARLFALKGYHDAKLEEIQVAAEVTTGAFFHHFRGKEDLAFAVLDHHMEDRRRRLDQIEEGLPEVDAADPLGRVFRRLDAIHEMVLRRGPRQGGCVIGNLSTALSDTHEAFRRRLAECFDAMALEFKPHLDAAVLRSSAGSQVDAWELARYIVAILEGSIMLTRAHQDDQMMARQFDHLKAHLRLSLGDGRCVT